jgi:histidyl-tRNA synthetase
MKIPLVKGTRDFYPQDMAVRNWIIDGWKKVSLRNGFEEYDGPIFEYLDMYRIKSGDEIVEQLFSLKDRGGRGLALRPEITPTLARMVNQKINSLPKPIKWFSVPRLFRAERPQKGRLREFFQWNIDIIGTDTVANTNADAEIIFTTLDYLRMVGLTNKDIQVKISSRNLLAVFLKSLGIPESNLLSMYSVLDKKAKVSPETFEQMLLEQVQNKAKVDKILQFMNTSTIPQLEECLKLQDDESTAYGELRNLFAVLKWMNVADFCVFDASIVRGLAYYTGIVFEVHDIKGDLRAICGGGRFDNLLHDFGGPKISATGMGMGDCVLEILLRERGLVPKEIQERHLDYFIALVEKGAGGVFYKLIAKLRERNFSTDFSYNLSCKFEPALESATKIKVSNLRKQLKVASERNAKKCIILGEEFIGSNQLVVKDMATGEQQKIEVEKFFAELKP